MAAPFITPTTATKKVYYDDKWPCCSGTFPQITADYGVSSYFRSKDGIFVNLYVPSVVRWLQGGTRCELMQQTQYPCLPKTSLSLKLERSEKFAMALRIPAWAGTKTSVAVNGKRIVDEIIPGRFLRVDRTWSSGDRVDVEFDMSLRLETVDVE